MGFWLTTSIPLQNAVEKKKQSCLQILHRTQAGSQGRLTLSKRCYLRIKIIFGGLKIIREQLWGWGSVWSRQRQTQPLVAGVDPPSFTFPMKCLGICWEGLVGRVRGSAEISLEISLQKFLTAPGQSGVLGVSSKPFPGWREGRNSGIQEFPAQAWGFHVQNVALHSNPN